MRMEIGAPSVISNSMMNTDIFGPVQSAQHQHTNSVTG